MKKNKLRLLAFCIALATTLSGCSFLDDIEAIIDEDTSTESSVLEEEEVEKKEGKQISFAATDIYGNSVSDEDFKNAKVVLLNLWEPWCGPCVREMPDLEALYEAYKDEGLIVVGVYQSFYMDDDAKYVISSNGITYPILRCNNTFSDLEQDYVPATYILDGEGYFLEEEPYAGSRSYREWEKIILNYLD